MTRAADNTGVPWVEGQTFGQVLQRTAERYGGRDALVFPQLGYRASYAAFRADVLQAARAILALGVRPSEHVAVWAANRPPWVVIQFATAEIGAVLVNINPAYQARELAYVLQQADVTTLFLAEGVKNRSFFDILAEVCPEMARSPTPAPPAACPKLRTVVSISEDRRPGIIAWQEFLAGGQANTDAELLERRAQVRPEQVVNVQYTSGATGFPKGAMLTHRNLLLNAYYVGQRLAFTEHDRLCIPVPFYHCFGSVMGTLMCAVHGAAMVVPAETFDPLATLQAVQAERCTGLYGVPTMFIAELDCPRFEEFDLSSLRTGIMAGSPCPIEVMRQVIDRMGARDMTIGYGLTEASPIITQTHVHDSLERRVSTVGTPLPGLSVRVVAPGTSESLPVGQAGELMVRGHGVMSGYYQKPKETADAITPDGWLHTGDLAVCTPDGYCRITGRIKDMIVRGGENISPREIEEFLYTHPRIAEVQVVGLPDERMGEEVAAWIRLRPGPPVSEEEIRRFCRGQIAHFKVPRYVLFVEDFPKTVTGKIQKFRLREMGIERFGLAGAARVETA